MSHLGIFTKREDDQESDDEPRGVSGPLAVGAALIVFGLLAVGFYVGGKAAVDWFSQVFDPPADYPGPGSGSVVIVVEPGDTATQIAQDLFLQDVVASEEAFIEAANQEPASSSIQPGSYQLQQQMAAEDALAVIIDPSNKVSDQVTIREGLRKDDILAAFAQVTETPARRWRAAAEDGQAIGLPGYAEGEAEGYLFPDTYQIEPDTSPTDALRRTTDRFKQVADETRLQGRASDVGLEPHDVVTVASIVQAETGPNPEDLGKIARVIYNRLDEGMPLQMDSTIAYIFSEPSVFVTEEQKQVDSPYNTFTQTGLPPGPISSPGQGAIEAALDPTPGDWLYFVTVNLDTGETKYATTLAEHERNVAELQRWLQENPS